MSMRHESDSRHANKEKPNSATHELLQSMVRAIDGGPRCRAASPMVTSFMSLARSLRLTLFLAIIAGVVAPWTAEAQVYEGRKLVQAELLANTTAIVPGKPFVAGVRLRMVPGWHTYWKFPGDAGLPTEIKWDLPAGWEVGAIQWPTPLKTRRARRHSDLRLSRRGAAPSGDHAAAENLGVARETFRRSQLARLREDLHPGRNITRP